MNLRPWHYKGSCCNKCTLTSVLLSKAQEQCPISANHWYCHTCPDHFARFPVEEFKNIRGSKTEIMHGSFSVCVCFLNAGLQMRKNSQGRCLLELATHWRSRKACKGSVARNVIGSLSQFCNSLFLLFCLGWLLVFDYTNFHETSTTAEWDVEACCRLLCCSSEQAVTHQTSFILCINQSPTDT